MLDDFDRYSIYWVPVRPDSLCPFGCAWMGWCAELGELRPRHQIRHLTDDIAAATRRVWRHGIHAEIAGPFRLRSRAGRWPVEDALNRIADEMVAVELPPLELAVIGGRVALVPASPSRELADTVALVKAAIAPITLAAPYDTAQRAPAVASDILSQLPASPAHRFHVPLTDPVDLGTAFRIRNELTPRLAEVLAEPRRVGDLALMGDPGGDRPLRVLQRFELRESAPGRTAAALPCSGPQTLVSACGPQMACTELAV